MSWSYDPFGNRKSESVGGTIQSTCGTTPTMPSSSTASYTAATNQVSSSSQNNGAGFLYDAAGNVLNDGQNRYLYDAEGRLCVVQGVIVPGSPITQYVYDASGTRVAKGSLPSWPSSCPAPTAANGFTPTTSWVLGPGGEQVTEYAVSGSAGNYSSTWQHTNAFTGGHLQATYHDTGTYFYLGDWLGTKRVEVGTSGCAAAFTSLAYGDGLTPVTLPGYAACPDATEHHFTGKDRDAESGNDYFGARYYSSAMGRFMSPDPFANDTHASDPQSWNLYAYVRNNPLRLVDPTGEIVENTDDKKHKLSKSEMKAIAKDLQAKTGLKSMNFDKSGQLGYDKNETASGGSAGLRDQITSAINSQTDVFKLADYSGSTDLNFMDTDTGTVSNGVSTYTIRIDFGDYRSAADLSDPQAMAAFSLGLGISHEIDHKFPSYNPNDTGPGGVIDFVNTFQKQLGLPTRDTNIHNITCPSGTCSIPFHDQNGQQHLLKWQLENSRH